jgi:glycine dehydrogenase subunit 1
MSLLGETGLERLARVNHANAVLLADAMANMPGVEVLNETFFNEFTIRVRGDAGDVLGKMAERGVLGGVRVSRLLLNAGLDDLIIVANTEMNTDGDRAAFVGALKSSMSGAH